MTIAFLFRRFIALGSWLVVLIMLTGCSSGSSKDKSITLADPSYNLDPGDAVGRLVILPHAGVFRALTDWDKESEVLTHLQIGDSVRDRRSRPKQFKPDFVDSS